MVTSEMVGDFYMSYSIFSSPSTANTVCYTMKPVDNAKQLKCSVVHQSILLQGLRN